MIFLPKKQLMVYNVHILFRLLIVKDSIPYGERA